MAWDRVEDMAWDNVNDTAKDRAVNSDATKNNSVYNKLVVGMNSMDDIGEDPPFFIC